MPSSRLASGGRRVERLRVEQVARDHRVEGGALAGATPCRPSDDVDVLEVVPDLGDLRDRRGAARAPSRTSLERELLRRRRCTGGRAARRSPLAARGGERDADERRAHRLGRGRLDGRARSGPAARVRRPPRASASTSVMPELRGLTSAVRRRRCRLRYRRPRPASPWPGWLAIMRDEAELGVERPQALEVRAAVAQRLGVEGRWARRRAATRALREPRVRLVRRSDASRRRFGSATSSMCA